MSASLSPGRAKGRLPALPPPKPRLTVVPRAASTASRVPFVTLVVALLAAGLVGLLLLNTGMERGAYRVTALRDTVASLTQRQQSLQLEVAALQDPQAVAERALRLGMVTNMSPAFLDLRTGRILGRSVPGAPGNRFDIGGGMAPEVGRLSKIPPLAAGADDSAGLVVTVPAVQPPAKSGDTGPTSRVRRR